MPQSDLAREILLRYLNPGERITRRELEIAACVMAVTDDRADVGRMLGIAPYTVSQHLYNLARKSSVRPLHVLIDLVVREYWKEQGRIEERRKWTAEYSSGEGSEITTARA